MLLRLCMAVGVVAFLLGCGRGPDPASKPAAHDHSHDAHDHSHDGHDHSHDGHDHSHDGHVHDHGPGTAKHSHGPDDVEITPADVKRPADYKDAIARIKTYRDEIEAAAASDRPTKAHRPLDELDIVLKWLPEIAAASKIEGEKLDTVKGASEQLRALFEKVHANLDANKNPDFAAVAKPIGEKIGELEAAEK